MLFRSLLEHTSHPDLPVYLAIKASIAVPFVFEPVIIGEYLYCDGGLCDNLPIEYVISNLEQSATAETEVSLEEEEKNIKTSAATSAATNTIATTDKEDLQPPPLKTLGVYLTTIQECISPANYLNASIFQYLNAVLHATFLHPTLMKKAKENVKNYYLN
mgnify:CR=1 FL=1